MIFFLVLTLLVVQRVVELTIARSNTAQLRRQGALEVGAGHYPVMVCLHALWFVLMIVERCASGPSPYGTAAMLGWSCLFIGQSLRWWTIRTLERRWTTRVIILPGAPLVESGPFRLLKHPNYLGVILEIVGVPLIGGCWRTAAVMGLAHAALLVFRIRVENAALRNLGVVEQV